MTNEKSIRIFDNATVIITGGASGIGRGFVEELSKCNCDIVIADLDIEQANEIASRLNAAGGKVKAVKVDVTDYRQIEKVVKETVRRTGRLDYIFNNAGIAIVGPAHAYKKEDWDYIIGVNLTGIINGIQAAYGLMIDQGFGHIINTASLAGLMANPGNVGYTTTKYAAVGLSTGLRCEAALLGIRVSALCPGFVRTSILKRGGKFGRVITELPPEQEQRQIEFMEKFKPMDPNEFAKRALKQIAKNEPLIVIPSWWKLVWLLNRLFPYWAIESAKKNYVKLLAQLGVSIEKFKSLSSN